MNAIRILTWMATFCGCLRELEKKHCGVHARGVHLPGFVAAALVVLIALSACAEEGVLETEKIPGEGLWLDSRVERQGERRFLVVAWFEDQLLGDGAAYVRRTSGYDDIGRRELRTRAVATLKAVSKKSHLEAAEKIDELIDAGVLADLQRHWIVNGFSAVTDREGVEKLKQVPGVRKVFFAGPARGVPGAKGDVEISPLIPDAELEPEAFDAERYTPPWYIEKLGADRVWKELGVTGEGVLNVVNDSNFLLSKNVLSTLYRNPAESPNGEDDDGNGWIDDRHGFDFSRNSANLTPSPVQNDQVDSQQLHGHQCAAIICGVGDGEPSKGQGSSNQLGIAPRSRWTGVIAGERMEQAVEWAIEHEADTYSMSFSLPGLEEYRSHWRKMFEHGALCGVHFVSGAGNFAQQGSPSFAPVPVQMRTPEDIPLVVFAAAGVQGDLSRTPFSSQGPVEWKLDHYTDGTVDKPEVCAFNFQLPLLLPNGKVVDELANGNSYAGPMFCGTIALMLSANPDLKPWQVRQIIIETARDVGPEGFDYQTGHGLIDAFAAVKQAMELKAAK